MQKIESKIKDDFQFVLLLSCFVRHPVQSYQSWNSVKHKIYPREYSGSDNFKFKG